jgi:predicted Zn-dependent protease
LWIANLLPYDWEEEVWEKNVKSRFNGQVECVDPEGRKALDSLVEKLRVQTGSKHKFDIRVINSPDFINAESTPGFHIFIYSGLLKINDPDGIAGVIAHEMGHSLKHHVIAIFINQMGVRAFYKAMLGVSEDNVAFDFINLKYSRDYERQADDIGIQLIKKANISPEGFRHSMEFLAKDMGDFQGIEAYLVDHPTHKERIEHIRANEGLKNPQPSLSPEQWNALKNICNKKVPLKLD